MMPAISSHSAVLPTLRNGTGKSSAMSTSGRSVIAPPCVRKPLTGGAGPPPHEPYELTPLHWNDPIEVAGIHDIRCHGLELTFGDGFDCWTHRPACYLRDEKLTSNSMVQLTRRDILSGLVAATAANGLPPPFPQLPASAKPHRIDVHHHFSPPEWIAAVKGRELLQRANSEWTPARSIEDMDNAGVAAPAWRRIRYIHVQCAALPPCRRTTI